MNSHRIVLEKGEWIGEIQRKDKAGKALTVQARWTLVQDSEGKSHGVLGVSTDVSERFSSSSFVYSDWKA
jgi:hypothetical protein